MAVIRNKIH